MTTLLVLIVFAAIIAAFTFAVIAIINRKNEEALPKNMKRMMASMVTAVGCLVAVSFMEPSGSTTMESDVPEDAEVVADESLPLAERVEAVITEHKDDAYEGTDTVQSIDVADDGSAVTATIFYGSGFTSGTMRQGILDDSTVLFDAIFALDDDISEVRFDWQLMFADEYGQESLDQALEIAITREEFTKINQENFDVEYYDDIAETYQEHPEF
ncbi:hypothetical protein D7Z54_33275 [Salibacterium salarium]|uniref:Uncharacterized protein n=1 Tax=Salibacterium salarium TaxID=284579 RepID=A0A428MSG2_9BACI|nr:hypothetical protein [Salibacterium salarium]RSL29054.1 hypothetical protein D7Z54_33275 [Salibacterium salarium]